MGTTDPPRALDHYETLELLGRGGESRVHLGRDARTGQPVAIKVSNLPANPASFLHELDVLSSLAHPGVVRVLDGAVEAGRAVLVMELIDGQDLLATGRGLDAERRDELVLAMLEALAYLHRRGVVHGDIKPANILVANEEGGLRPVFVDFGMALRERGLDPLGGTPAFMAPELGQGLLADFRTDVFALGVTLLQFALGSDRPRRTIPGDADLSPLLRKILPRLLNSEPERRFADAGLALSAGLGVSRSSRRVHLPARLPLVGRDREIATMTERIVTFLAGKPQAPPAIAISGVRGLGRRRLLTEVGFRARSLGLPLVTVDDRTGVPALFRQVRRALGLPASESFGTEDEASGSGSLSLTPAQRAAALIDRDLEGKNLLVLAFLGSQGGGELRTFLSSLVGLERAHRALGSVPRFMLVVGGAAEMVAPLDAEERLELEPLQVPDVQRLLEELLGESRLVLFDRAAQRLVLATGGVPLLVENGLHALVAEGAFEYRDGEISLDLDRFGRVASFEDSTATFRDVQERLSKSAREILQAVAVTEGGVNRGSIEAVLEGPVLAKPLAELLDSGVLIETVGNREPLYKVRDREHERLARGSLDAARGKEFHQRWAQNEPNAGRRLRHLLEADAVEAVRKSALSVLLELQRQGESGPALDLAEQVRERRIVSREQVPKLDFLIASLQMLKGFREESRREFHRLLETPEGPAAARQLAELALHEGSTDEAASFLQLAWERARDDEERSRALRARAWLLLRTSESSAALSVADAAALIAKKGSVDEAWAISMRGLARFRLGDEGAQGDLMQAREIFDAAFSPLGFSVASMNLALFWMRRGDYDLARPLLESAASSLADLGYVGLAGQALTNLGILHAESGAPGDAVTFHRQARRAFLGVGDRGRAIIARASEGFALWSHGRTAKARRVLNEVLHDEEPLGHRERLFVWARLGRASHRLGRPRSAKRQVLEAMRLARGGRSPREKAEALLAAAEVGRPQCRTRRAVKAFHLVQATASTLAAECQLIAGSSAGLGRPVAPLVAPLGWLEDARQANRIEDAVPLLARALRVASRRGDAYFSFLVRMTQARWDTASDRWARALRALRAAFGAFSRMEDDMTVRESACARIAIMSDDLRILARDLERKLVAASRVGGASLAQELGEVLGALHALNSETTQERLLERILDGALRLTAAQRAFVVLKNDEGELHFAAARDRSGRTVSAPEERISTSIAHDAIALGRSLIVGNAEQDPRYEGLMSVARHHIRSLACVALKSGHHGLGALYLDGGEATDAFPRDQMGVLEAFADLCALSLRNLQHRKRASHEMSSLMQELVTQRSLAQARLRQLRAVEQRAGLHEGIVGRTPALLEALDVIDRVADSELSVLITGETGTGKELFARRVHDASRRRDEPFMVLNCAAVPESLFERELFGHEKGAFTGAFEAHPGLFRLAHRGTLFLDEIGELPLAVQSKLLRALQESRVRALGGSEEIPFDTRIVVATLRDVKDDVANGRFREDLYYRIKGVEVTVPPLRDRRADIPLLVEHFAARAGSARDFSPDAMKLLLAYRWPGNVRELQNEVHRALHMALGPHVEVADLSEAVRERPELPQDLAPPEDPPLPLREVERRAIVRALQHTGGDRKAAAKLLGISRSTLYKKIELLAL